MMSGGEISIAIGVLTLSGTLLAALVTTTWRFSSLATKLTDTVKQLQQKDDELKNKFEIIEKVPGVEFRVEQLEELYSHIPNLLSRVAVLEAKAEFSKEMRQSKPKLEKE